MKAMLVFNRRYFALMVALLFIEVFIAFYVHDGFVRPYLGDFLVVILLYCFLKSFLKLSVWKAAILVWLFSFFIEGMQYLNLIEILGLEQSKIARTVIGHSFSWMDLFAYTAGMVTVILIEQFFSKQQRLD